MKLRSLRVANYRAIGDLALSFLDDFGNVRPVTVLAGPNGCGKTSLLFAIVQALRGATGYKTGDVPPPSDLDIRQGATQGSVWRTTPTTVRVELELEFDTVEQEAIPELYNVVDGTQLDRLPDGRLTVSWVYPPSRLPDGRLREWWSLDGWQPRGHYVIDWLRGRLTAIRAWRARKAPRDFLERIGGLCLFPQDRNLRERVLGERPPGYRTAEGPEGPGAEDEEPRRASERSVEGILKYVSAYARGEHENGLPEGRNWEKRIQEVFARICAPKQYLGVLYRGDDVEGAPCFKDGEHVYSLDVAASGEQVIIEYLTRLTYPSPLHHSLVLIDEPEAHLHPAWGRQLYLALAQMGENNQYILATHSPELRERAAADGCLVDLGRLGGNE